MAVYYPLEDKHLPKGGSAPVPERNRTKDGILLNCVSSKNIRIVKNRKNKLSVGISWPDAMRKMGNADVPIDAFLKANPGLTMADLSNLDARKSYNVPLNGYSVNFYFKDKNGKDIKGNIPVSYLYHAYETNRREYLKQNSADKNVNEKRVEMKEEDSVVAPVETEIQQNVTEQNVQSVYEERNEQAQALVENIEGEVQPEITGEEYVKLVTKEIGVCFSSIDIKPTMLESDVFMMDEL